MDPARTGPDAAAPSQQFRFEFAPSYRPAAIAFGVRDASACVTVTDSELLVRFGPWRVRTGLSNIESTEFTGPFAYPKTAGPAHLTFSNKGLTFATTGRQGLLIRFYEPIRGLDPWGLIRHPDLTVTVLDRDALAVVLQTDLAASLQAAGNPV